MEFCLEPQISNNYNSNHNKNHVVSQLSGEIDTYLHTIPITAGKVGILHDFCCVKLQNTDTTDTTSYLHIRILPF